MHAALQYAVGVILVALWSFRQDFPPEYQRYIYDTITFCGYIVVLLADPNAFWQMVQGFASGKVKRPTDTIAQVETHTNVVTTTPVVVPAPEQVPAPVAVKESATIVRSRPLWFPRPRW